MLQHLLIDEYETGQKEHWQGKIERLREEPAPESFAHRRSHMYYSGNETGDNLTINRLVCVSAFVKLVYYFAGRSSYLEGHSMKDMEGTGSGRCEMVGFGKKSVDPSSSATIMSI
jgi:hypothetical protein